MGGDLNLTIPAFLDRTRGMTPAEISAQRDARLAKYSRVMGPERVPVMPKDRAPGETSAMLQASWTPAEHIRSYFAHGGWVCGKDIGRAPQWKADETHAQVDAWARANNLVIETSVVGGGVHYRFALNDSHDAIGIDAETFAAQLREHVEAMASKIEGMESAIANAKTVAQQNALPKPTVTERIALNSARAWLKRLEAK